MSLNRKNTTHAFMIAATLLSLVTVENLFAAKPAVIGQASQRVVIGLGQALEIYLGSLLPPDASCTAGITLGIFTDGFESGDVASIFADGFESGDRLQILSVPATPLEPGQSLRFRFRVPPDVAGLHGTGVVWGLNIGLPPKRCSNDEVRRLQANGIVVDARVIDLQTGETERTRSVLVDWLLEQ